MLTATVTSVRSKIYEVLKQVIEGHEPLVITGKTGNVVMISEEDYKAMQETMYLLGVPGMRESIIEGIKEPLEVCSEVEELNWDDIE